MKKALKAVGKINLRLYLALLVTGLCPTIYTTVRTFFLGQLPGEWSYSIAGQLSWVNLFYEVVNEAIILPLFFFMGKALNDRKEFTNRVRTGLLISCLIYSVVSALIIAFARPLLTLMAASPNIIDASVSYIRIESIANVFNILFSFSLVAMISLKLDKAVYLLTGVRLLLCLILDTFLVSSLSFSMQLDVNGIGISNILTYAVLFVITLLVLHRHGVLVLKKAKLSFHWAKDFFRIGGVSGLESLVRNVAYVLMVSRMVNMVGEQGTYWVANNFIWGWLLLPVIQLGELIKQETAENETAVSTNTHGYLILTGTICLLWIITIPLYKPFMLYVLGFTDVEKLFSLVTLLLSFYILYAFQNIFDCTFYGRGKTNYMLFESIVTNSIYYGTFFILYLRGIWTPTLTGIALMFGIGNAFDSIVSGVAYAWFLKKRKLKICFHEE